MQQQDETLPVPRVVLTQAGEPFTQVIGMDGTTHLVRMVTFLPGMLLEEAAQAVAAAQTPRTWRHVGQFLARTDRALRGFFHPQARQELLWDVTQCGRLRPHTVYINNVRARAQVEQVLDGMETTILPSLRQLRHQVIHNDGHGGNVLVDPDNPTAVCGLLDFGDMVFAPLVQEIAIAVDIARLPLPKLLEKMGAMAAGYDTVLPLEAEEIDTIYDLVLARQAVTATIIAWRKAVTPEQPAFLPESEPGCWDTMADLLAIGKAAVCDELRRACRFPVYSPMPQLKHPPGGSVQAAGLSIEPPGGLMGRRTAVLGAHLEHFYTQPVHVERGKGVWLYGLDGRAYLDAYNNVPTVGHAHPHVVKAVARQTAVLNTNTRYLYRIILDYAERLVSTLPEHITVCAFVNSGSEANDIAWRMAQFITGQRGALVMENAYHGITDAIKPLSPGVREPLQPHVRTLISPNPYRGLYRTGEPDLAAKYAADADRAIADLAAVGLKPAAFMLDSAFVSNGSPDVPAGYVAAVVAKVRAAGGLFIADEVQSGFGRMGQLWGHGVHGELPDIVTMGKPVGNGFPLGVVATTADILNRFVQEVGLFSTFGGNPVACAAGMAVLDVLEMEGLVANAAETGDYLREGLRDLMARREIIGDVRGRGLVTGVELVRDRETKEPARKETLRVLDGMRDRGVLIGDGGENGNVLKIRPPLVFRREHADILVEALDGVFREVG
jgi:4-aminobutyrate aminotransferase-like enzyme/Ser/Thr protein kinase RdoA (MazF antagonist)